MIPIWVARKAPPGREVLPRGAGELLRVMWSFTPAAPRAPGAPTRPARPGSPTRSAAAGHARPLSRRRPCPGVAPLPCALDGGDDPGAATTRDRQDLPVLW